MSTTEGPIAVLETPAQLQNLVYRTGYSKPEALAFQMHLQVDAVISLLHRLADVERPGQVLRL